MRPMWSVWFWVGALCWAAPSWAVVEVAGVRLEDTIVVSKTMLRLNGAGVRYKGPFKVYVGDLYVSQPVKSLDELVAAPGPKRLTMTFLREINSAEFGKMLTRGIEDNVSKQDFAKIIPGLIKMGNLFAAHSAFVPGDSCAIEWDPAKGLGIWVKGKLEGEYTMDPAFFRALMSIWLGQSPADWKLKEALLGG